MQNFPKPKKIKIVLLGNRSVGKSSIIRRFILDDFPHDIQPTVGVDYMSKTITFKGSEYRLQLWDTAGQQKYRSLVKGYLKGAHACLYVYDYKNINSYMDLVEWVNLFQSANSENHASFIAGNKWDLCNKQSLEELEKTKSMFKSKERKLNDFEELFCSAKTSENINEIFIKIVEKTVNMGLTDSKKNKTALLKHSENYFSLKCCQN